MGGVDWEIRGPSFNNCNCAWGCPCQFNAPPTHGDCRAFMCMQITQGHFGNVSLDGLRWIFTGAWPGAVHEGNGTWQSIIDVRADEQQRAALVTITHGEETGEGATMLQVYNSMCSTRLEPLFLPIEFTCDIQARTARVVVPGLIESTGEPIRNPVTGAEHRVRVTLPDGFEYTEAEYGSGTTKATGEVALDYSQSYGQFAMIHLTQNGPIR